MSVGVKLQGGMARQVVGGKLEVSVGEEVASCRIGKRDVGALFRSWLAQQSLSGRIVPWHGAGRSESSSPNSHGQIGNVRGMKRLTRMSARC